MLVKSNAPAPQQPIHFNSGGTVMATLDMMILTKMEGASQLLKAHEVTWAFPHSRRQVLLSIDEDGWWNAEVPSLPGALSQGRTREEALANIREAIELVEEVMRESGDRVPVDRLAAELVTI
jgi:predicted RNase H-like HicB family nuclease